MRKRTEKTQAQTAAGYSARFYTSTIHALIGFACTARYVCMNVCMYVCMYAIECIHVRMFVCMYGPGLCIMQY